MGNTLRLAVQGAALLACLFLATKAGAQPQPAAERVHVRIVGADVGGMPSTTQLAAALDAELKTTVALVAVAAICPALCIEIAFDVSAKSVFVRVVGAQGEVRERRLLLPEDASQWLQATVLLAGNLVRDEAAALIAGLAAPSTAPLTAPPAAPSAPPTAPPTPPTPTTSAEAVTGVDAVDAVDPPATLELRLAADIRLPRQAAGHTPFSFGLVPPLSMDFGHTGTRSHDVSIDLLVGVSGGSRVLSLSGLFDAERGDVDGLQLAGVAACAAKHRAAVQVAGVFTCARSAGVQIAGFMNMADTSASWQIAGGGNVVRRGGVQLAGGSNTAWSAEVQIAGVTNVAHLGSPTLQLAGFLNSTPTVRGAQIALFNAAVRVEGLQLGAVNVALKSTSGVQIGVINIAGRDDDGVAIGAINFIPGGRTEIEAAVDSDRTGAIIFRHGSRKWHNIYGLAGNQGTAATTPTDDDRIWMYGFGMGRGARVGAGQLDVELMAWHVGYGTRFADELSLLSQLRVSYGYAFSRMSLIGGLVANTYISDDGEDNSLTFKRGTYLARGEGDSVRLRVWPTAFLGLRF